MKRILILGVAALFAAACTTTDPSTGQTSRNNAATGAILGALAGAAAGSLAGGDDRKNILIGAGVGALAGAGVGAYMDRQQRELEQQLSGTGVGIRREGDNIYLVMPSDVTFATNSAAVTGDFVPVLVDVAATLNKYPKTLIDVEGHTDSTGAADYNRQLSQQRASNVSEVLLRQGVDGQRVVVTGFGEDRPVASNDTAAGRERNRRVEIRIVPLTA